MTTHNARLEPRGGLVNYAEAAELVGVRPATVRWWVHKGWLAVFVAGLFHTDDVYRCERERRHAATVRLERMSPVSACDGYVVTMTERRACRLSAGHGGECTTGRGGAYSIGSQRHASVNPASPKIG